MSVAELVVTDEVIRILTRTRDRNESAPRISLATGVPIATTYRVLRKLEGLGLVSATDGIPGRNGRRQRLWKSAVVGLHVSLRGRAYRVTVLLADGRVFADSLEL